MEKLTIFMERMMAKKSFEIFIGVIAILAPLYFLKTLYAVWFGPMELFIGFQSQKWTWFVLTLVDAVSFLTTLPSREKGRVMQVVIALWTIEMGLVFVATIIR